MQDYQAKALGHRISQATHELDKVAIELRRLGEVELADALDRTFPALDKVGVALLDRAEELAAIA